MVETLVWWLRATCFVLGTLGVIGGLVAAQADGSRPGRLIYQR